MPAPSHSHSHSRLVWPTHTRARALGPPLAAKNPPLLLWAALLRCYIAMWHPRFDLHPSAKLYPPCIASCGLRPLAYEASH